MARPRHIQVSAVSHYIDSLDKFGCQVRIISTRLDFSCAALEGRGEACHQCCDLTDQLPDVSVFVVHLDVSSTSCDKRNCCNPFHPLVCRHLGDPPSAGPVRSSPPHASILGERRTSSMSLGEGMCSMSQRRHGMLSPISASLSKSASTRWSNRAIISPRAPLMTCNAMRPWDPSESLICTSGCACSGG